MNVAAALLPLTLVAGFVLVACLLAPRLGVDSRALTDRPARWSPDAVTWDDGAWLGRGPDAAPTPGGSLIAGGRRLVGQLLVGPRLVGQLLVGPRLVGQLLVGSRLAGQRVPRRLAQLFAGLVLYGASMAFLVRARLGVMPWDVLHQGLARWVHLSLGTTAIAVGVVVLLGWIPLRQVPGVGTVCNVVVIGVALDAVMPILPAPSEPGVRVGFVVLGLLLNAVATAAYIGAGLGPGPRDGLMTGLVRRRGWSVRVVRSGIEVSVVVLGWLLGGNLGPGTLLYALAIGPLVHPLLPRFAVAPRYRAVGAGGGQLM